MPFSLLVLDCDGVILQNVDAHCEAMRRIGEPFGSALRDRLVMYQRLEGGISRDEKFRWLYREAYGRTITEQEMRDMHAAYTRHLDAVMYTCEWVPGLGELLAEWHGKVPIGVCSGAPQKELERLLAEHGVHNRFFRIGGYPPGKTALLRDIVAEAGVAPEHTVMVGDTVTDLRAAEENGTLFFGIGPVFAGSHWPHGPDNYALSAWLRQRFGTMP